MTIYRDLAFVLAAGAAHLVTVSVGAAIAPDRFGSTRRSAGVQEVEVDVNIADIPDLMETPVRPDRLPVASREMRQAGVPLDPRNWHTPPRDPNDPNPPPEAADPETAVDPIADPAAPGDFSAPPNVFDAPPPFGTPYVPGAPGSPAIWAQPGIVAMSPDTSGGRAPTQAPRREFDEEQGTKAVARAMRAKDKRSTIDRPWASAIGSIVVGAVRASDAPHESRGTFTVSISGGGVVQSVRLVAKSGGPADIWKGVEANIAASLKSRTFAMGSNFSKGAVVTVTAISAVKMPGGGVGREGTTLSFDVSDIGAKPTRVVSRSISVHAIE